ncbi:MAG: hypothetical protein JHD16_14010 [Solirubrobacteraceae bacterium]|nr:hypothetical protein [Solirubrobacteraceae bacterium]
MFPRPAAALGRLRTLSRCALVPVALLVAGWLALPSPAVAAQRVEVFDLPSAKGNVDLRSTVRLNRVSTLRATVILPEGYDEQPGRRWPVLYMLHGVGDNTSTWIDRKNGDLVNRTAGYPAIIVMPEGGRSYWVDQWLGGRRVGGNWRRYLLDEVIPTIEARYRILPGRDHHAIGGLSMGGYGAMLAAAELPTYFGAAISFSGLLNLESWGAENLVPPISQMSFTRTWGRPGGPYQKASSPKALLSNLGRTRLFLTSGNGTPDPASIYDPAQLVLGSLGELGSWSDTYTFYRSARARGIPVTYRFRQGLHTWLYWRRDVPKMLAWNPFAPAPAITPAAGGTTTFRTMSAHGNAFGLGFRFDALPRTLIEFKRTGQTVSATGSGRVTITPGAADADASGNGSRTDCQFTATLPFSHTLPAGC